MTSPPPPPKKRKKVLPKKDPPQKMLNCYHFKKWGHNANLGQIFQKNYYFGSRKCACGHSLPPPPPLTTDSMTIAPVENQHIIIKPNIKPNPNPHIILDQKPYHNPNPILKWFCAKESYNQSSLNLPSKWPFHGEYLGAL